MTAVSGTVKMSKMIGQGNVKIMAIRVRSKAAGFVITEGP